MMWLRNVRRRPPPGWPKFSTSSSAEIKSQKSDAIKSQDRRAGGAQATRAAYGQPTPQTHPHLLKPGELVPATRLEEFAERREKLVASIAATNHKMDHVVVIPSADVKYMSDRIPYFFRQNTDFRYLTGCLEPDSLLLLKINRTGSYKSVMFVRENTKHSELWEGPRTGSAGVVDMFGVDEGYGVGDAPSFISSALKSSPGESVLWYNFRNPAHRQLHYDAVVSLMKGSTANVAIQCPQQAIHKLRLIKSASERALMRRAGAVGCRAMCDAIASTRAGATTEHQLYAALDYSSRMNGAQWLAYPPVVAAGNNANIIHYTDNAQMVHAGETVLVDAGCEVDGYCSDITRCWPADGQFTDHQLTVYEIVAGVQRELVELCRRAGDTSLDRMFDLMTTLLGRALKEAHILSRQAEASDIKEVVHHLCPHHVSHYLGMDVHDTGSLPRSLNLQPGMCFTVEPGLYIDKACALTKPEFRGCGIRIEDDVLMTESGAEILTDGCPKTAAEIQKLVGTAKSQ